MSAIRVVRSFNSEMVSVIDEATGRVELVEMAATEEHVDAVIEEDPQVSGRHQYRAAVDTIIADEPDASGRYHYTP